MTLHANGHVSLFALGPKKRRILPGAQLVCLLCPLLLTTPAFAQETEAVDGPEYTWEEAAPYLDAGYYCESLDVDWEDCTDLLTGVDGLGALLDAVNPDLRGEMVMSPPELGEPMVMPPMVMPPMVMLAEPGELVISRPVMSPITGLSIFRMSSAEYDEAQWLVNPDPYSVPLPGDLNGDDSVDVADVQILINFLVANPLGVEICEMDDQEADSLSTEAWRDRGLLVSYDLNGDGTVDQADLERLLQRALAQ